MTTAAPPAHLASPGHWFAVAQLGDDRAIWFARLRPTGLPERFVPVLFTREGGRWTARSTPPATVLDTLDASRTFEGWGHRFFWSEPDQVLVVQQLELFDPSPRTQTSQLFFGGSDLSLIERQQDGALKLLARPAYEELWPERVARD